MDKATVIGLVLGVGAIFGGQVLEGGSIQSIMQVTAAIIVFGGTFGAVFISFPFHEVIGAFRGIKKIIKEPPQDPFKIIRQITNYTNKARKEGILSLEKEVKNVEDPFLKKSLTMAVDGVEPNMIREVMEKEIEYVDEHGRGSAKVFKAAGGYAPTIGILGAVLGLIHVMENLNDPEQAGVGNCDRLCSHRLRSGLSQYPLPAHCQQTRTETPARDDYQRNDPGRYRLRVHG